MLGEDAGLVGVNVTYHISNEISFQVTHTSIPDDGGVVWPSDPIPDGWDGFDSWHIISVSPSERTMLWGRYIRKITTDEA